MKQITTFLLTIRHLKPDEIKKRMEEYQEDIKKKYPNDQELGKYIRNN